MNLLHFKITGFGRFRKTCTLNFSSGILCIVGPNEAGKSTLLRALQHLNHDQAIEEAHDPFEDGAVEPELEWRFRLTDEEVLRAKLGLGPRYLVVTKKKRDARSFSLEPPVDLKAIRMECSERMTALNGEPDFGGVPEEKLDELNELAMVFSDRGSPLTTGDVARAVGILRKPKTKAAKQLLDRLTGLALNPAGHFANQLPHVQSFDPSEQRLEARYEIESLRQPPPALRQLSKRCELDLNDLARRMKSGLSTKAIQENVDAKLRDLCSGFSQGNTECAIQIGSDHLEFLIREPDASPTGYTKLALRSDGFRRFLSTALFAVGEPGQARPILVVDEIERHLHYDAQSDIITMLEKQRWAANVVYTTHSLGCLPSDWSGLKVVQKSGPLESKVVNKYWSLGEGYRPLIDASGAASLAFLPLRPALLVEGATDALLLPSLMREACGLQSLEYSVVPGLTNAEAIPRIARVGSSVQFCVDNDKSGRRIASALEKEYGKTPVHFYSTEDGVELEDFVRYDVLAEAASRYMARYSLPTVPGMDLVGRRRAKKLEDVLKKRGQEGGKADIVYELLAMLREEPTTSIVEPTRLTELRDLHSHVAQQFSQP